MTGPSLGVHVHLEDAVAALHVKVCGVFLLVVLEPRPAHKPQALFPLSCVRPFVSLRAHASLLLFLGSLPRETGEGALSLRAPLSSDLVLAGRPIEIAGAVALDESLFLRAPGLVHATAALDGGPSFNFFRPPDHMRVRLNVKKLGGFVDILSD